MSLCIEAGMCLIRMPNGNYRKNKKCKNCKCVKCPKCKKKQMPQWLLDFHKEWPDIYTGICGTCRGIVVSPRTLGASIELPKDIHNTYRRNR